MTNPRDSATGLLHGLVSRGVVRLVDDSRRLQELQVETGAGDVEDRVERFGQYGLTSAPRPGAEALVVHVGASPDHPVALAVEDRSQRPTGLSPGEVMLYNDRGARVHLKDDGAIELTAGSSSIRIEDGRITFIAAAIDFEEA
ncbi:MAG: phage baseplate assembly protein V [Planctomycetota bacterium]